MNATYNEISALIANKNLDLAEQKLKEFSTRDDKWHYLYSIILLKKSWFEGAKEHLYQAISMNPENKIYRKTLAKLMGRGRYYSSSYHHRPRYRRRGCGCCCCDCCDCDISCCDLICLDSCCECMGGDLIECI